ncbi:FAD binding domain-containing protein [Colletotrichum karsti]|uniref:FAD binding domain-containing protein n=1 Tax=Colletotrichum karsti TaxID=1095194 RepID=A0A9P6LCW0_9PEZI|nr:FAD binding domain-containing protein [Colletotrichum karsti]KAF9869894.1 FAD binding domain-containing protein [Colletotrichum karsti]
MKALPFVSIALVVSASASLLKRDAGSTACSDLKGRLGSAKVATKLELDYTRSKTEYFNIVQNSYSPSCAVFPTSTEDVATILKSVRAAGSRFAIKTEGHNPNTFFSSVDNGVLIDLTQMNERTYDETTTLGTYQPGGKFGDIYDYFAQFDRTVVGARLSGVGSGLALGGGLSYLSSQYGLAVDSFRELEVVLPSGEVVTASPLENEDLFFAMRGGGGNAFGVVTKYKVQTRPIGKLYAGNLIYLFNQTQNVLDAIGNFTLYNEDPKAAIIGTYEKLGTPALGSLNLDDAAILFLVYDGDQSGAEKAFGNFTSIPHLLNTLGTKTYKEVVNMPLPNGAELSRGKNQFRNGVYRIPFTGSETGNASMDNAYRDVHTAWTKWAAEHKGAYTLLSLDYQPIPKSLTDASKNQNGGNAMQMPDGPWLWLCFLLQSSPFLTSGQTADIEASFKRMVESVPFAKDLPLFINDAHYDQDPLKTFTTYGKLQEIKAKYDPLGFFTNYTGGWNFDA